MDDSKQDKVLTRTPVLTTLQVSLPFVGIAAYSICYATLSRFYTELGVPADDVGLNYQTVLSKSVGLLTVLALVVTVAYLIGRTFIIHRPPRPLADRPELVVEQASRRFAGYRPRLLAAALGLFLLLAAICVNELLGQAINSRDDAIMRGQRVSPITLFGVSLISIHADPATIPAGADIAPSMLGDKLFYLGDAKSEIVLYDVTRERTLLIPSSDLSVLLRPIHARN